VFLALLFHDAVYVPGSKDNERESAALASRILRKHTSLDAKEVAEIHRMILATRDHRVDEAETSRDLRATVDIDMSILGASWEDYVAYATGVRNEYVPGVTTGAGFSAGRSVFLSKVLRSKAIFHTPEGVSRWEERARANVSRELADLRSGQNLFWRAATAILGAVQKG
jgi:predicted metal-dependent HD superfamily phosphohydrolase